MQLVLLLSKFMSLLQVLIVHQKRKKKEEAHVDNFVFFPVLNIQSVITYQ